MGERAVWCPCCSLLFRSNGGVVGKVEFYDVACRVLEYELQLACQRYGGDFVGDAQPVEPRLCLVRGGAAKRDVVDDGAGVGGALLVGRGFDQVHDILPVCVEPIAETSEWWTGAVFQPDDPGVERVQFIQQRAQGTQVDVSEALDSQCRFPPV